MITFNLHTKNGNIDVHINSQENPFTFKEKDSIKYENNFFIVSDIEYIISNDSINQVIQCSLKK